MDGQCFAANGFHYYLFEAVVCIALAGFRYGLLDEGMSDNMACKRFFFQRRLHKDSVAICILMGRVDAHRECEHLARLGEQ